ncbi:hypothetical protein U1Q18_019007 [Sarracenia purpurea var. burkii]
MQRRMWKRPKIIAMKGQPCTGKSTVASSLAQELKCPLLALDDIRDSIASLQHSLLPTFSPAAAADFLDLQSYEAICRIAIPQLRLGLDLVIDSPLSCRPHLDRLLQLSANSGANLVVVECKPQDKYQWEDWLRRQRPGSDSYWYRPSTWEDLSVFLLNGYESDDVSKVVVDTTQYVRPFDLLFPVERLAATPGNHCIEFHDWMDKVAKGLIEDGGVEERKEGARKFEKLGQDEDGEDGIHYFHYHELSFLSEEGGESDGENRPNICRACLEPIPSGTSRYKCNQCQLSLHKHCAELPNKKEIKPQDHPQFLKAIPDEQYSFAEIVKCDYCGSENKDFNEECPECVFEAFIRSAELPSVVDHPCHGHQLCVMIVPISFRSEFLCQACGDPGKHIRYHCYDCGFQCHLGCALLPRTFKQERHHHPLTITSLPQTDDSDEFLCDACEANRNQKHWVYYCGDCDFVCHLSCMTFGNQTWT